MVLKIQTSKARELQAKNTIEWVPPQFVYIDRIDEIHGPMTRWLSWDRDGLPQIQVEPVGQKLPAVQDIFYLQGDMDGEEPNRVMALRLYRFGEDGEGANTVVYFDGPAYLMSDSGETIDKFH